MHTVFTTLHSKRVRAPLLRTGESANGKFPDTAVRTMAAIVANAETGVDYYSQFNFIR